MKYTEADRERFRESRFGSECIRRIMVLHRLLPDSDSRGIFLMELLIEFNSEAVIDIKPKQQDQFLKRFDDLLEGLV